MPLITGLENDGIKGWLDLDLFSFGNNDRLSVAFQVLLEWAS
jgi:hypothetical protein